MDTTIRNLDPDAYRELKAKAALTGKTIGQAVNEAIRAYLAAPPEALPAPSQKTGTLRALKPEVYPPGNEELSAEIDAVVYGVSAR